MLFIVFSAVVSILQMSLLFRHKVLYTEASKLGGLTLCIMERFESGIDPLGMSFSGVIYLRCWFGKY